MSDHPAAPMQMPGIPIETDAAIFRREAQEAQRRWLVDPTSANQETYGRALARWAKLTRNRHAMQHARALL